MFTCERCGASYNPLRAVSMDSCPRCRVRDEVLAPLSFAPFTRRFADDERQAAGDAVSEALSDFEEEVE